MHAVCKIRDQTPSNSANEGVAALYPKKKKQLEMLILSSLFFV